MNNNQIEQEIQANGLTAPRVTPEDIEANIRSEHYFSRQSRVRGMLSSIPLLASAIARRQIMLRLTGIFAY